MGRDSKELVIEQLADELAEAEALLVNFRMMAQVALEQIAELTRQNDRLRSCLRDRLERRFSVDLSDEDHLEAGAAA